MKLRNPVRDVRTIKTLLEGAEAEAHATGDGEPGAEHLLIAAIDLPDGSARRAFERVGTDPDAFRAAVTRVHEDALAAVGIDAAGEASTRAADATPAQKPRAYHAGVPAQAAFQEAAKLAKAKRGGQFAGAHVVIAVAETERGTAARALEALGIDRAQLADAARAELAA
jgi:ATP-dependent Clp protease ATP-binding subunit ClpA